MSSRRCRPGSRCRRSRCACTTRKVTYTLTLTSAGLVSRVKSSYAATGVFDKSEYDGKTITYPQGRLPRVGHQGVDQGTGPREGGQQAEQLTVPFTRRPPALLSRH